MSVPGFDFSTYQDDPATPAFIDFDKAKAGGMEFCIARAAYGMVKDSIFPRGFDEAKKAGLITGCTSSQITGRMPGITCRR